MVLRQVGNTRLEPGMELQPFTEVTMLSAGASTKVNLYIDFGGKTKVYAPTRAPFLHFISIHPSSFLPFISIHPSSIHPSLLPSIHRPSCLPSSLPSFLSRCLRTDTPRVR